MLELNRVTLKLSADDFTLVDALSCVINPGEKIAVIGSEGTGKSSLLKTIIDASLTPHILKTGHITCHGKIAYLEQDIQETWRDETVLNFFLKPSISEAPDYERSEALGSLSEHLQQVGFPEAAYDDTKKIHQYSGGEIVKLGIIKLLLGNPDILLLDEPTNDLDFETILFLEDFIKKDERSILYISHDERLLSNTATGIIHLKRIHKRQKAVTNMKKIPYDDYKTAYHQSIETQTMTAKKQRADHKQKIDRFRRIYQKVEHQQNQVVRSPSHARLLKKKIKALKSQERRYEKEEETFLDMPEKEDALDLFFDQSTTIPKGKTVASIYLKTLEINHRILSENIALTIKGPEKIAITGKNGTGKTTFLKALYDTLKDRKDISLGYMPQKYDTMENNQSALTFLMPSPNKNLETRVRKIMGAVGFQREEMVQPTRYLSGGQKAKLYLLKMVLDKNDVLILDEPTRNLSPLSAPEIHSLIHDFGGAVIAVTHDRAFLEDVFDSIYELTPHGLIKIA